MNSKHEATILEIANLLEAYFTTGNIQSRYPIWDYYFPLFLYNKNFKSFLIITVNRILDAVKYLQKT